MERGDSERNFVDTLSLSLPVALVDEALSDVHPDNILTVRSEGKDLPAGGTSDVEHRLGLDGEHHTQQRLLADEVREPNAVDG